MQEKQLIIRTERVGTKIYFELNSDKQYFISLSRRNHFIPKRNRSSLFPVNVDVTLGWDVELGGRIKKCIYFKADSAVAYFRWAVKYSLLLKAQTTGIAEMR